MTADNRLEARYRPADMQNPVLLSTSDDVDSVIDALLTGPALHDAVHILSRARPRTPAGFPEREMYAGVSRELQVGALALTAPEVGHVASVGVSEARSGCGGSSVITGKGLLPAESEYGDDVQALGHRQKQKGENRVADEPSPRGKAHMCPGRTAHAGLGDTLRGVRVCLLDRSAQLPAASLGRDTQSYTVGVAHQQGSVHAGVREGRQQPDGGDPVEVDGPFAGQGVRSQVRR